MNDVQTRLEAARDDAQAKAWDALARYKFWQFGYHASRWVQLNRLLGDRRANPFRDLVHHARRVQR